MVVEAQRLPVERLADAAAEVAATGDLRVALDSHVVGARIDRKLDVTVIRFDCRDDFDLL